MDPDEKVQLKHVQPSVRHFACTQCGKCCNRSPEVELSEAAALADLFVWRLMFRMHRWPSGLRDYAGGDGRQADAGELFYQTKRLLGAHAARKSRTKVKRGGKTVDYDEYLFISALSLDTGSGACSALAGGHCSIYDRRPLTCRTVPLQYWRVDAALRRDFDSFAATPGFECDTAESAPMILDGGRIVDEQVELARSEALAVSLRDSGWREAILRRLKTGREGLPTLREIEASASLAATTVSMRVAWEIGVETDLLSVDECRSLFRSQAELIDRQLSLAHRSADLRQTLMEMQADYRNALIS